MKMSDGHNKKKNCYVLKVDENWGANLITRKLKQKSTMSCCSACKYFPKHKNTALNKHTALQTLHLSFYNTSTIDFATFFPGVNCPGCNLRYAFANFVSGYLLFHFWLLVFLSFLAMFTLLTTTPHQNSPHHITPRHHTMPQLATLHHATPHSHYHLLHHGTGR